MLNNIRLLCAKTDKTVGSAQHPDILVDEAAQQSGGAGPEAPVPFPLTAGD